MSYGRSSRARRVWFAFGAGAAGTIGVAGGVLAPVLGLIGTVGTLPFAPFPFGRVAVVVVGYLFAAALLAAILRIRNGALAWTCAVAAVVAALAVSVYPLLAAAMTVAEGAGEVIPTIVAWLNGLGLSGG